MWSRSTGRCFSFDMIAHLRRYYALCLLLSLVAPLWFVALSSTAAASQQPLHDALIWSAVFFGCWLLITTHPGFQIKGHWRKPAANDVKLYLRLLLGVLLVDFGSKALFFRSDRLGQVELFKNFGLQSVFHPTAFEPFHLVLLIYFLYLFCLGALHFRFSSKTLDRLWLASCAFALGGAIALLGERLLFGGVHDSFYFAGRLMWFCPPCASPRFASYAWTPADFFVHAAFMPVLILIASYFTPAVRPLNESD